MRNEFINDGAWAGTSECFDCWPIWRACCVIIDSTVSTDSSARLGVAASHTSACTNRANRTVGTETIMLQVAVDQRQELERQLDRQQHNDERIRTKTCSAGNRNDEPDGDRMRSPGTRIAAPQQHPGHANRNGGGREWRKDCPDVRRNVADVLLEWAGV